MTDSMKFGPEWFVTYYKKKTWKNYSVIYNYVSNSIVFFLSGCARLRQATVAILAVVAEEPQL